MNVTTLLFDLFEKLLDFSRNIYTLLFEEINILGLSFTIFDIIGSVFGVLIIAWLVKKIVPVV